MLNARSAALLTDVLNGTAPSRARDIAERFGVSERTAKADLQALRTWLAEEGLELSAHTPDGITLDCTDHDRAALLEKAFGAGAAGADDRVLRIACEILVADPAISINQLAITLDAARNTVLADLTAVEELLRDVGVRLVRDSRIGLTVDAPHPARRDALVQAIHGSMGLDAAILCARFIAGDGDVPPLLALALGGLDRHVPSLRQLASDAHSIALQVSTATGMATSDSAAVSLFLRLLAIVVLPDVSAAPAGTEGATADERHRTTALLLDRLEDPATLRCWARTDADTDFALLELGLRSSSERLRTTGALRGAEDVAPIARELIARVGAALDAPLDRDRALLPSLIAHLSDRLAKIHLGILEPSPVLAEVIDGHPAAHRAVREATDAILEPAGIRLSDTDCAYLTIHVVTSLQRLQRSNRVRALLVCATGRGTTQLIRSVVETQLQEIDIVRTCSVLTASEESTRPDIDLVISTFPFTTGTPLALVRPIPTDEDLQVIARRMGELTRTATMHSAPLRNTAGPGRTYHEQVAFGVEVTASLAEVLGGRLDEERRNGLLLHCLLLAKRIADDDLYAADLVVADDAHHLSTRIAEIFRERQIELPPSEVAAIAEYAGTEQNR